MTCERCIYWNGTYETEDGECTRYPTWIETNKSHFCGESKIELRYDYNKIEQGKKPINYIYEEQFKGLHLRKSENDALRKEIKELRRLYKKTVGKNAVIRSKK